MGKKKDTPKVKFTPEVQAFLESHSNAAINTEVDVNDNRTA